MAEGFRYSGAYSWPQSCWCTDLYIPLLTFDQLANIACKRRAGAWLCALGRLSLLASRLTACPGWGPACKWDLTLHVSINQMQNPCRISLRGHPSHFGDSRTSRRLLALQGGNVMVLITVTTDNKESQFYFSWLRMEERKNNVQIQTFPVTGNVLITCNWNEYTLNLLGVALPQPRRGDRALLIKRLVVGSQLLQSACQDIFGQDTKPWISFHVFIRVWMHVNVR